MVAWWIAKKGIGLEPLFPKEVKTGRIAVEM